MVVYYIGVERVSQYPSDGLWCAESNSMEGTFLHKLIYRNTIICLRSLDYFVYMKRDKTVLLLIDLLCFDHYRHVL